MNSTDPTVLQAIAGLFRSAWAFLIAVLSAGIAWGYHQREISQHRQDIEAIKRDLKDAILDGDKKRAEFEAQLERRRAEDKSDLNRRFDELGEGMRDIGRKLDAFILRGRE